MKIKLVKENYGLGTTIPFAKGKAKCLCKPPSNFFAGGNGPFPLGEMAQ